MATLQTVSEPDLTCSACGAEVYDIDVKCESCGAALASTGALRMIGGVVLGQYEITEVLGQGGMSIVYKGHHQLTEQEVALKVLPPELAAHQQVKSRFLEEAKALAQLDHPNIVHLYNFGEDNGCFVLAMQFVRGETLERVIWAAERLDWRQACKVGIDTLRALEFAHSRGVVHRDMKPSNILVRASDGSATVMDFGIAKMTTSTRLTATGQTMGTVRYMSPEQVRGHEVDRRTDIYSFAVTLYEAVVGDTPFDGETHFEIMTKHLGEAPVPPSKLGIDVPPELEAVIMQGLAKNPDDRPATAAEFASVLTGLIDGEAVPEFRLPTSPPVRKSQLAETAAAADAGPLARPRSTGLETKIEGNGAQPVRSRTWLLWAVAALVAAAGAGITALVVSGEQAGAVAARDASADTKATADAAPRWPNPHLIPDLRLVGDQRYADLELRVVTSGSKVQPETVRAEIAAARSEFTDYLRGQGVQEPVAWEPLNVVVVAGHVLCDPRIYERGEAPADCSDRNSYYRPAERKLYVVEDDERRARSLPYDVGLSLCLHRSSAIPDCERTLTAFLRARADLD